MVGVRKNVDVGLAVASPAEIVIAADVYASCTNSSCEGVAAVSVQEVRANRSSNVRINQL